jgi:23S rRNA (uridine2552-2'-O)-methyltransferase
MSKPYDPRDAFYRRAKQEGFRARSAYKLQEIARRFGLFRKGMKVLDLGAAPGGWLQVIAAEVGPTGLVVGADLEKIAGGLPARVKTLVLDLRDPAAPARLREYAPRYDVVTSDMAPKTTGVREADEARSLELVGLALEVAREQLAPGGSFVAKVFEGGDFEELLGRVRESFVSVRLVRPEATRDRSREIFVVARGLRSAARPEGGPAAASETGGRDGERE